MKIYIAFKVKEYEPIIVGVFDNESQVKELIDKQEALYTQEFELNQVVD